MRLVVFGWGNEARGDDALGPLLLRRIAARQAPEVETVEDCQLQIEHALDLVGFDAALFLDADRAARAPCVFREIRARAGRAPSTHALAPEAVLQVFAEVERCAPPPAFVLGMRGERFGLGEELSARGAEALTAAGGFCEQLLASRSLEHWRRLTSQGPLKPGAA